MESTISPLAGRFRYQKLVPLSATSKITQETEDIRKGFQLLKHVCLFIVIDR